MKTIQEALIYGTHLLDEAGIPGARLDAQVLLCHVLGIERSTLYAYPEREISSSQEQHYQTLLVRRKNHEPVAYLVGHKAFYGREFVVDHRVLIPRPETELLVECALGWIKQKGQQEARPIVADIGSGSGAIPITLALEELQIPIIYAVDISDDALAVARLNCERYQVSKRVCLLQGDLVTPLPEPVDILVANLPYVGTDEIKDMTDDVYHYEPHLALFSGPDGLVLLRKLCKDVQQFGTLKPGGVMILEIGYLQRDALTHLLHELWPGAMVTCLKDYAGFDRILQMHL